MKRRITAFLVAMAMALASLSAEVWAVDSPVTIGGVTYTQSGNDWIVTGYDFSTTDVTIQDIIGDGTTPNVVEIANRVFSGSNLSSITIPSSVTKIGDYAFSKSQIETIAISGTGVVIGSHAFSECTKLTEVSLQEGVKTIGDYAFSVCENLESIIIPGSTETVGEGAFQGCISLSYAIVRENKDTTNNHITTIEQQAFLGCTNLQSVFIAKTAKLGGPNVFLTADKLAYIHYGGDNTSDIKVDNSFSVGKTIHVKAVEQFDEGTLLYPRCKEDNPPVYDRDQIICTQSDQCGYVLDIRRLVPTEPHTPEPIGEEKAATCGEEGITAGSQCALCGKIIEPQQVIPALAHTFEDYNDSDESKEWAVIVPATCKDEGLRLRVRKCSICGQFEDISEIDEEHLRKDLEEIEKLKEDDPDIVTASDGHTVEVIPVDDNAHVHGDDKLENITVEPTCQQTGLMTIISTCKICGKPYIEPDIEIPMADHTPGEVVVTYEPDECGKPSVETTTVYCEVCNQVIGEPTTKTVIRPHDFVLVDSTEEATCTEDGYGHYKCSICGEEKEEVIPATGHTWGEWEIIKEPTCEVEGEKVRTCEVCGETETEAIDALGHAHAPDDKGRELEDEYIAPTCTEPGKKVIEYDCINGDHTFTETIDVPATGHKPAAPELSDTKIIKEPTCTEEGSQIIDTVCEICHENLQGVPIPIPALGHDFGEWTTDSNGVRTRTCSRCGEVQTDSGSSTPSDPSTPDNPDTPSSSTYTISVIRPANGAISSSVSSAASGTVVTLTFTPNAGYELDLVQVTRTSSGRAVTVSGTGNNRYSFIMPAGNVEVQATFTAIPGYTSGNSATGTGSNKNQPTNVVQSTPQAGAAAQMYNDVPSTHWASGEIAWVSRQGYMSGSGNIFNPDGSITQQQLWMVLARMMGQNPASMEEARRWAAANSFASGSNPSAPTTRQQLVTALYRAARLMGSTNNTLANLGLYTDSRNIDASARNAMAWAVANGILSGTADGLLNPTGYVTRAQFAAILYRFYQRIF